MKHILKAIVFQCATSAIAHFEMKYHYKNGLKIKWVCKVYSGMNRYENGKIYKIVDIGYKKMYIGSTTESLKKRFERHRSKYLREFTQGKGDNTRSYWLFQEFGVENCRIELIKNYPCNSREELEREEGKHIKENDCINKIIAGRTIQEPYKEENEYICFQQQIYRELHPDKRQEEGRKRYEKKKAEFLEKKLCGKCYTQCHRKRHEKTKKHQDWLNQQNND